MDLLPELPNFHIAKPKRNPGENADKSLQRIKVQLVAARCTKGMQGTINSSLVQHTAATYIYVQQGAARCGKVQKGAARCGKVGEA